jgi:2-amino-4-hydroxy-6-hydroxymethyldihydropteridine diphosphokinase
MFSGSNEKKVVIALGSNLGDSHRVLREAIRKLQQFSVKPVIASSFWATEPVDCPPGSAEFVNAVVEIEAAPNETPESLLTKLQATEAEFGRVPKEVMNEPRRLDLDIIMFGGERRASPELTLPHPRAHLRRFVLEPLSEIDPTLKLPGQSITVLEMLGRLPPTPRAEKLK